LYSLRRTIHVGFAKLRRTVLWRLRRAFWRLQRYRRRRAFGQTLRLTVDTEFPESLTLRYPRHSLRQKVVQYTDYVQLHSLYSFVGSLPSAPTVLELGAHHGVYATLLGLLLKSKQGRFVAVEPSSVNAEILRRNIHLNGLEQTVEVEEVFVLDTDSDVLFKEAGAVSSLGTGEATDIRIRCEPIGSLLRRLALRHIHILIMDVEGAEVRVLQAFPWQDVTVSRIYCELHPGEWSKFGNAGTELANVLHQRDLLCLDMYLNRYEVFPDTGYIGPTLMIPRRPTESQGLLAAGLLGDAAP